jgi:hypothetical protein
VIGPPAGKLAALTLAVVALATVALVVVVPAVSTCTDAARVGTMFPLLGPPLKTWQEYNPTLPIPTLLIMSVLLVCPFSGTPLHNH